MSASSTQNRKMPSRNVDESYPPELVNHGLLVKDDRPLQPGESREIDVEATDAAWEIERLTSLLNDPDNRFGALLFFYTPNGDSPHRKHFGPDRSEVPRLQEEAVPRANAGGPT